MANDMESYLPSVYDLQWNVSSYLLPIFLIELFCFLLFWEFFILSIKEREINSQRYYYSPLRLAKNLTYLILLSLLTNSIYYWWECKMIQLVWREIWQYLTKTYMHLPFDPVITVPRIYPKEIPPQIWINISMRLLIAVPTVIAKYWKQPKCSSRRLGE